MKAMRAMILLALCLMIATAAAASETIKIGAVLSVTGPASFLGEPEKNTLLLLEEQINASGGILGKQIELVIYDDETNVNKCVLAADKLIKKDRVVAVVGPTVSGNTLAIMNKFPRAKTPLVSCAAAEKIVKPVNPWVFKTPQTDRHAVQKILTHAQAAGLKNIAILTVSNGFGQAGRAVLKELVPAGGMNLIADEVYGPKDTDMTVQLTKIKSLNPDAIICWGTNPGPAVVAMNRVQLGIATPLYMSHGVASRKFIELAGEAANGLMLPAGRMIAVDQIPADHPQQPVLAAYVKDYETKFNIPVSTFGGYAYDALMLVKAAIEKAGSADPSAIRDSLESITGYVGATGEYNFSKTEHNGLDESAFVMVAIENGDWKVQR
ncbi:ABC transporter substrate-binding protein [Desulfovibrio ferrophilus]|uniref:ABC transporter substrate binding protein n=1 Tax=Desulfovibrio ferrophilus TaxID=241368 RepID=A0A2Z6B3E5_9BACT|nr:ABC transporter substrate-binding protein [Desulfovibrio ferrophilus]BBD10039.1 ABC transporter substrate binding protein precursor [Desulfovibrio ferrophilus]